MSNREVMQQALEAMGINQYTVAELAAITALRTALEQPEQQAEPPPEWPLIKNILAEYGLDAIAFVAEFKAAQRPWVGLTPEEVLDLFDINNVYGSKWVEFARTVEAKLKKKNT